MNTFCRDIRQFQIEVAEKAKIILQDFYGRTSAAFIQDSLVFSFGFAYCDPFGIKLRKTLYAVIDSFDFVPCILAHNPVGLKIENFLELSDCILSRLLKISS